MSLLCAAAAAWFDKTTSCTWLIYDKSIKSILSQIVLQLNIKNKQKET